MALRECTYTITRTWTTRIAFYIILKNNQQQQFYEGGLSGPNEISTGGVDLIHA